MEPTCGARAMEWSIQLEMGLRSAKPGAPVKAILEMEPRLWQWSREPESGVAPYAMFGLLPGEDRIFANAILLRLADAFRGGDIETRLSVVRVFLSERKHRNKEKKNQCKGLLSQARVANHLELLKRVKSVFDSGDLESKALALVLLGCWADFLKDNAQIRYLIFSSLVSAHDCEVRASLYATGCFCEVSDDFASVSVEMLFNIMSSSSVSLPVKLAAARVLAKCKSSYSVSHKAYKTGMELVLNSSDEDFIVAMLYSLSKLACILIPLTSYQVDFLLLFLNRERTSHVKETALKCLHFLFRRGLCENSDNSGIIRGLFSIMEEPEISMPMQYKALRVLHKVLLSIPPSSLRMELREFMRLQTIIEDTSQYPGSRKSCLAICILADLCCRTKDRAAIENVFGTNGWTAYKVGVHAACQGEWSLATIIFRTLIQKVKSVSCCSWLNALFHYSNSEEKFQLPRQPKQGTTSIIELVGTIEFPLSCDYKDDTCPGLARNIYDCNYYDQLTQSHMELCSSLKVLEASATSSQEFCFQRWFLSLRARVLENLVCVVKTLREVLLNVDQNLNQVETESNDKLQFLKSYQDFNQISLQLFKLAEEFNLLRASFIGMDSESSEVLAAHSLSSSVLAFVTSFGVSNIDQDSHRIFIGVKTSSNLQALTIQNLQRLFWCVDNRTRASFSLLLNYFDLNENCLSPGSGYRACSIRYKDREVVNVCTYAVSSAVCLLQKTASEFTKNALSLVSSTLIKLMHIHLGIPKYFFKVRPFIGAELFLHNEDSVNGVEISVSHGSHITLNICLQLKNVPLNLLVKSTKCSCILHCSTSFLVPCGQTLGHSPSISEAWKDGEIFELNQKLVCHVLDGVAGKRRIGMHSRAHGNSVAVETFMDFRPNEKGQGFSHCSLDVSNFPVGSYRIKWHSCMVDSQDSYWSLLPLNPGPVFFVTKPRIG
ncbi:uncharacterized protein LOC106775218 isoform X2 [Vigna radiata var. radiata]|uniref:Uncharacterized protein LOC106775218 isoform X2 n=1 Tax=Vigna radiata var. radiata TaxID=3916 RepID=A0A3Q0FA65_VIGRR|nr:uncharacterized protein LOC106775218 isoform X2 [Vigna radiata var. radiata]